MRLRLITGPTAAVSVEEAKDHCDINFDDDNAMISRLITAAVARIETEAGRAFNAQTWEAVLSCFPDENIELTWGPLVSVTSIKYIDADGDEITLDSAEYEIEEGDAYGVIVPLDAWPTAKEVSNAVVVRYVAGDGMPEDVKNAVLMLVRHWYDNRGVSGEKQFEVPYAITDIVRLRRRMFA